jgi:hypothetical protein
LSAYLGLYERLGDGILLPVKHDVSIFVAGFGGLPVRRRILQIYQMGHAYATHHHVDAVSTLRHRTCRIICELRDLRELHRLEIVSKNRRAEYREIFRRISRVQPRRAGFYRDAISCSTFGIVV